MGFSFPMNFNSEKADQDASMGIKRALLEHEYSKVGGKENYEILQKYSQQQINENINTFKQALNGDAQ
jgi:bisphosphoglycerate-dependent phosphoglycerate mutase